KLLSYTELLDYRTVAVDILLGEVVEKISSVTYHLEKTAARMMVILVCFDMFGECVDSVCKNRYLHLGRTCISLMCLVLVDKLLLYFLMDHVFSTFQYKQTSAPVTQPQACG